MIRNDYTSLSVVIPVYNSEDTIAALVDKLFEELEGKFDQLEVILVNDDSQDDSHSQCLKTFEKYSGKVKYFQLSKNFGEHSAVMCGLSHVSTECVAIIDDDFQNPPEEIIKLVDELRQGFDVVFSSYDKKHHHFCRNLGSKFNDIVASYLLKKPKNLYLSSFKVMNKFLVDTIIKYQGPYAYIDGLILRTTNNIGTCLCRHEKRSVGKSNYTLRKLVQLWLNMFTGYSLVPLRISTLMGLFVSGFGVLLTIFFIMVKFSGGLIFAQKIPPGWASTITVITFFSGVQLCVLGVLGEYLGRLFLTVNKQPQFIVRKSYEIHGQEEK